MVGNTQRFLGGVELSIAQQHDVNPRQGVPTIFFPLLRVYVFLTP
jgi:hypothetical protein